MLNERHLDIADLKKPVIPYMKLGMTGFWIS